MERAVYFDGWYAHAYCQHPSMPPRRLRMLDDLSDMRATVLVWAGLGGGSISLPYLEEEASGPVPARFRQYGYVNEAEFIAHARERGIDLFTIVFEAQAWELPAEVVDGEVLAQTELRGVAPRSWVGLREFSTDTGPASWKPFRHYFPEGLRNSDGEEVVDLWEEVASRDLDGEPLHAHWVEVDAREQHCYYADRNNPVWREYLKAIVRMQIDAGARAVQLDETETPMGTLRYGGCFCKDCMKEFRSYLQALPAEELPPELEGEDLAAFDYRSFLRARGHGARENPRALPLYQHYTRCLQLALTRTFAEVATHARDYARSKDVEVRVAGNFFDCGPQYDPIVDHVDVLVTEMRETRYQQPWWFRHGVGLSRGKPLVAVENPYGGVTAALLEKLQHGKGHDLFQLTILEATAMGANMALPYGSWLGTEVEDAYWVPRELVVETGRFLERIDPLVSSESPHRTAVVFSVRSMLRTTIDSDQNNEGDRWYAPVEMPDAPPASYWETIEHLSRSSRTFDVLVLPDEGLRADDLTLAALERYDTLVLPDVWGVSPAQHATLLEYLDAGGHVVVHGVYGTELPADAGDRLRQHPSVVVTNDIQDLPGLVTEDVVADLGPLAAVSVQVPPAGGLAVHLVNYDYDDETDQVRPRRDLDVGVRSAQQFTGATVHAPGVEPVELPVREADGAWTVTLPALGAYAVVHLEE